jgi:hypothetical protein
MKNKLIMLNKLSNAINAIRKRSLGKDIIPVPNAIMFQIIWLNIKI